jgi:L-ascorbate metabolism protein UlaG (beta-lactamase superfamily)
MGRFDDLATQPARGLSDLVRWRVLDPLRGRGTLGQNRGTPPATRPNDGTLLRQYAASATWIGHATYLLRLGGLYIATDPVWSETLPGLVTRAVPAGVPLSLVPPIDVVTVSHNHYDHLDLPTLKRIGPDAVYVTPLGNGTVLRSAGLRNVVELQWWQSHRVGALDITLVPARHWSMRMPWDRNDNLWGGFVLSAPEGTAYHSGDTGFFEGFGEIARRMGAIDWAMLPIGAYAPRWFMEPQHMDPSDAGKAFDLLSAKNLLAMHWGTFHLTDEPLHEPSERMRAWWQAQGLDPARLWILDIGETRPLQR